MPDDNPSLIIISGGQTGVDRAALDVAIELEIDHSGWCPKGRKAEDGKIPDHYNLTESSSNDYKQRTLLNIQDSDGTLILFRADIRTPGTGWTMRKAQELGKPVFLMSNLNKSSLKEFLSWIKSHQIVRLNVAGPRESKCPGIYNNAVAGLRVLFSSLLASGTDPQ